MSISKNARIAHNLRLGHNTSDQFPHVAYDQPHKAE